MHLGRTPFSPDLKALEWDDKSDGLTIRLDERHLQELTVVNTELTDDQKLWEDLQDEKSGWKVTSHPI